jgi:hypothetical protein
MLMKPMSDIERGEKNAFQKKALKTRSRHLVLGSRNRKFGYYCVSGMVWTWRMWLGSSSRIKEYSDD